jgi:sugar phosphate isomerase/epimerase
VTQPDAGLAIGMSVCFLRNDLETAVAEVADLGFDAVEIFGGHLGPGLPNVRPFEAHAAAAAELVRRSGLVVSTLNVVGAEGFDPFGDRDAYDATVALTADHLRLAAAMGSPRILVWDGRIADPRDAADASARLAGIFDEARTRSGLSAPPAISVELHPFTFALQHRRLNDLAAALRGSGAGICLDLCHFGVGLGNGWLDAVDDEVLAAIDHVHYSDTDLETSELHFPLGLGRLDLDAVDAKLAGRGLAVAWDLFGWPAPRAAVAHSMARYRQAVAACARS